MSTDIVSNAVFRSGNQMVADGALRAGCRFFAGYPITPATGIFKAMVDALPARKGLALSTPDEISAIAYTIGAAMRGYKAMTATSGPGWALMIESVQYALMTETPLVVALVQRLGPSTGGATQGGQGDVLLAEFATSGGYTIPVLSPSDAHECSTLTYTAFRWAERLRTPVIVLSDKEIAMTSERVDLDHLPTDNLPAMFDIGEAAGHGNFWFESPSDIPPYLPVGGDARVITTGSAHDMNGKLQKNSPETIEVLKHLEEKIRWRASELEIVDVDRDEDATTVLVSYGITTRAAQEAVEQARERGISVTHVAVKSLFPVPWYTLGELFEPAERIIVAEENLGGLYRSVLERRSAGNVYEGINKIGSMITPREILRVLEEDRA